MNNVYVNIVAKIAMCWAMIFALASPAAAQTWQPLGKGAMPVVVANTACNNSTDTVGLTANRTSLLTCQSGVWKSVGGSPCGATTVTFTIPGSYPVSIPAGCMAVKITACAGGGSGAAGDNASNGYASPGGGGGRSGQCTSDYSLPLYIGGGTYTAIVGGGGMSVSPDSSFNGTRSGIAGSSTSLKDPTGAQILLLTGGAGGIAFAWDWRLCATGSTPAGAGENSAYTLTGAGVPGTGASSCDQAGGNGGGGTSFGSGGGGGGGASASSSGNWHSFVWGGSSGSGAGGFITLTW